MLLKEMLTLHIAQYTSPRVDGGLLMQQIWPSISPALATTAFLSTGQSQSTT